jgi:hypothetical protein
MRTDVESETATSTFNTEPEIVPLQWHGPVTDDAGTQFWHEEGDVLHRGNDLPAVITAHGTQVWYWHGKKHREGDLPALVKANGDRAWYKHGVWHRNGGLPACILVGGNARPIAWAWFKHGKPHRDDDLPAAVWLDGRKAWFRHGLRHRERGKPAFVWGDGSGAWFVDGLAHRDDDLPALVLADGRQEWWVRGEEQTNYQRALTREAAAKRRWSPLRAGFVSTVAVAAVAAAADEGI